MTYYLQGAKRSDCSVASLEIVGISRPVCGPNHFICILRRHRKCSLHTEFAAATAKEVTEDHALMAGVQMVVLRADLQVVRLALGDLFCFGAIEPSVGLYE